MNDDSGQPGPPEYAGPPFGQASGGPEQPRGQQPPGQSPGPGGPVSYPHQQLLPQDVRPGRSRTPLIIGLAVVLLLLAGGAAAYLLLRDDGEQTREAYCDGLRELLPDGDLLTAVSLTNREELEQVVEDAPAAVADDWEVIDQIVAKTESGSQPTMSDGLNLLSAVNVIVKDARNKCDLPIDLPELPTN